MDSQPAARKALLFSVGDVRFALRLSQIREIVATPPEGGEIASRGELVPALPVSMALGLPVGPTPFALLVEGSPAVALRVEALHGIVDLAHAEVLQLPARTVLPQPPPFQGAIVASDEVALELVPASLGWAPIEPAADQAVAAPGAAAQRELVFLRGGTRYGVPLPLIVHVFDGPRLWPVPLTPPSHRGLLWHGRALHPVFEAAVLLGEPPPAEAPRSVVLIDAGGTPVGVAADRVLAGAEAAAETIARPSWDALFSA